MNKQITLKQLMDSVKTQNRLMRSMYILTLEGQEYRFTNTDKIEPFVKNTLGYTIIN